MPDTEPKPKKPKRKPKAKVIWRRCPECLRSYKVLSYGDGD